MSLDQKYRIKAQNELHETDEVREQCLEEFRDWLDHHDYFVECRKDEKFLLQFLRSKKFKMDKTKDLFESYMLLKHSVPRWCDFNDESISRLWMLYETGVAYPLTERDSEGRRIIFIQPRRVDPKVFSFADGVLLVTWIAKAILEEEETQIAGLVTIVDHSELTFAHVRMASVGDAIDFVSVVKNGVVGRLKGMYHVALPSFASFLLEVAKKAATEKLRKRIHVVDNMDTLRTIIDPTLLPLEHGGTVPEAEMMKTFKKFADTHEPIMRSIQDTVDWDRVALEGQNSCSMM